MTYMFLSDSEQVEGLKFFIKSLENDHFQISLKLKLAEVARDEQRILNITQSLRDLERHLNNLYVEFESKSEHSS